MPGAWHRRHEARAVCAQIYKNAVLAWLEKRGAPAAPAEIGAAVGAPGADALAAALQALQDDSEIYVRKGRYAVL